MCNESAINVRGLHVQVQHGYYTYILCVCISSVEMDHLRFSIANYAVYCVCRKRCVVKFVALIFAECTATTKIISKHFDQNNKFGIRIFKYV